MVKFNRQDVTRLGVTSPVTTTAETTTTHEGAPGFVRDIKGDLFLLAVSCMVGENTFYERAEDRDARYRDLVAKATLTDPVWTASLLRWLRTAANMRSASLVGAAEFARALSSVACHCRAHVCITADRPPGRPACPKHGTPGGVAVSARQVVSSVLQRADEPGEMLAYWRSRHGRTLPTALQRGVADAVTRLYSERSLIKYDNGGAFRFGDVIRIVHPRPADEVQSALFAYAIARRHDPHAPIPPALATLTSRAELTRLPVQQRRAILDTGGGPIRLRRAGFTWESLAAWLQGPMDAQAWAAIVPSMGYMALLRNLRNFDQAGLPDEVAEQVIAKLTDPYEVAASRQFPFRFLSAYRAAPSLRWGQALERALDLATGNIPALRGRTLVLVDVSGSMKVHLSERSKITLAEAGALFGIALAKAGQDATLAGFATGHFVHKIPPGASVLRMVDAFCEKVGSIGYGTETARALRATYDGHDRVVVITDEQTFRDPLGGVSEAVPAHVPMYAFNLGGYAPAMMETGRDNRHEFGGLSDATFDQVPLLERGRSAHWPWEKDLDAAPVLGR